MTTYHKTCNKCRESKLLTEFYTYKHSSDGRHCQCKECAKADRRARYADDPETMKERNRQSRLKRLNPPPPAEPTNEKTCKVCNVTKPKTSFSKDKRQLDGHNRQCKECAKKQHTEWRELNPTYQKQWRVSNANHIKDYNKEYKQLNKQAITEYNREYSTKRKKEDPLFRLRCNMRSMINEYIKKRGYRKGSKTEAILGCSFEFLKEHLENQFKEGMSWDNRERWHVDHIIPISYGQTEEEVIALNHYSNLQPLWAEENEAKRNYFIG